jgi:hypothetical protein
MNNEEALITAVEEAVKKAIDAGVDVGWILDAVDDLCHEKEAE